MIDSYEWIYFPTNSTALTCTPKMLIKTSEKGRFTKRDAVGNVTLLFIMYYPVELYKEYKLASLLSKMMYIMQRNGLNSAYE